MENKLVEDYLQVIQEDYLEEVDIVTVGRTTLVKLSRGETAIGALAVYAAIIYLTVKAVLYLSTDKLCRKYKSGTKEWNICGKQVDIKKKQKQIAVMKSRSSLCNQSKNPEKCKEKVRKHIDKLNKKIKEAQIKIKELEM